MVTNLSHSASKEKDLSEHHDIIPNGYNIGRDELVKVATPRSDSIPWSEIQDNILDVAFALECRGSKY